MSYCRWSSDGFKSDLYVYESVPDGWVSHVADRRHVGIDTLPPDPYKLEAIQNDSTEEWQAKYSAYHAALDALPFEDIDHPLAGKTFIDPTAKACAERLKMLKAEGFYVPDGVIEELESEEED